jgi:hypothetical protein
MKRYLLDTNIFIAAYDRYYRNEYFPTFWEKFSVIINQNIVIPKIVKDEITKSDWFLEWLKVNYEDEIMNHKDYSQQWQRILDFVQSCGLYTDKALIDQTKGWANEVIADPWLVAIAKEEGLILVSDEDRIPNLGKGNLVRAAKIPDICDRQSVRCINRNEFFGEVGLLV